MNYSYKEVIDRIENTRRFGKYTGLEVSKHILERLGNPQSGIPFVHIAGTNGKGSTTAFLCSILQQTGKKIGMFTSPHLITFRERIRINGEYISEEDVTRLGNLLLNTEFELPPTMFDYCLAMAVLYFKEQQCDLMVIETGIGGRYDSTNALGTPLVAVITKIGFDHTAVLGDTLEQIAGEKAGIIKKGCQVVTTIQQPSVKEVLLENFLEVNHLTQNFSKSDFMDLDMKNMPHCSMECRVGDLNSHRVENCDVNDKVGFYEVSDTDLAYIRSIPMKMKGSYQIENAATAMLAAKAVFAVENHFVYDQTNLIACICKGIAEAFWKGRMELVNEDPFFMIDGAHNAHGVHALAESLKTLYPNEKFHFIMAVMADKDYEDMIEELLPLALDFVTVTPESNRALQSKDLAECIAKKGIKARYAEDMHSVIRPLLPQKQDVEEGITRIRKDDGETHIYLFGDQQKVIAFGSLYFIGEIEAMLEGNRSDVK